MRTLIFILLLLPVMTYANTEIENLNSFTQASKVFNFEFRLEESKIEAEKVNAKDVNIRDDHRSYIFSYAQRINQSSFLVISVPYIISTENEIKSNGEPGSSYHSRGIQEPTIKYFKRYKTPNEKNEFIKDFGISVTPSLCEKHSGTKNANKAIGGHVVKLLASSGALYQKWEARALAEYTQYFASKDVNKKMDSTFYKSGYYQLVTAIEIQYKYTDKWYINFGSGLQLTQDAFIKGSEAEGDTRVQFGSGSLAFVGTTFKNKKGTYKAKIYRAKNDFFIESPTANFKGDFNKYYLSLEYGVVF